MHRMALVAVMCLCITGCGDVSGSARVRWTGDASRPDGGRDGSPSRDAAQDASAAADTGDFVVDAAPYLGPFCDGASTRCDSGPFSPVSVSATTPAGTLTFGGAAFNYTIGFENDTQIQLFPGRAPDTPTLTIIMSGNPLAPQYIGDGGPGDHDVGVSFTQCTGAQFATQGVLHVYSHTFTRTTDGGTTATLDASLVVNSPG